ncbi:MAG TPA: glycosyltransferase family 4 protein, partial [Gemmatimonadaceae bacterium]|nr:glycosyltransferase family 4 protein [Gemmatimonadaceae bacterium]
MSEIPAKRTVVQVVDSGLAKHGSFEDFMIQLAARSARAGLDLHFIFPAVRSAGVKQLIETAGAKVWVVPGPWNTIGGARAMIRVLGQIRPRVADFHFGPFGAFVQVYVRCRLRGIRVFYHYHGEIRPLRTLSWTNRQVSQLRVAALFVDRFIPVSHANAEFLRALNIRTPTDVIYNGIEIDRFRTQKSVRVSSDEIRLLSIGSMISRKRVDILLRAIKLVSERTPNVRLTLVGGGASDDYKR